jgi:coenzyme F420-reducing hydrogenase beta subunit
MILYVVIPAASSKHEHESILFADRNCPRKSQHNTTKNRRQIIFRQHVPSRFSLRVSFILFFTMRGGFRDNNAWLYYCSFCVLVFIPHLDAFSTRRPPSSSWSNTSRGAQARRRLLTKSKSKTKLAATRAGKKSLLPAPIDPAGWPLKFPAKEHCSKCGLCETTFVSEVKDACAFLELGMSKIDDLEVKVHGRRRQADGMVWSNQNHSQHEKGNIAEEARFGVLYEPVRLAQGNNIKDAQWTGVVTGIARSMLESGQVDAVVCIANSNSNNDSNSWAAPEPILARTVEDVMRGRGVKPALAPSLRVLDEIQNDDSIRRLLFCGVGCAVQAFRAVQDQLHLDEVYVLGTNCADNSPTPEAAERFLRDGVRVDADVDASNSDVRPKTVVTGYEFMQDFQVHVKIKDGDGDGGAYIRRPYFSLPGTIAEQSIAKSCLACFDYTNALADVVVGYMGAPLAAGARMDESFQTLTVRNERGAAMVHTAVEAGHLRLGDVAVGQGGGHEQLAAATVQGDTLVMAMTGRDVPESGMPVWMGKILAFAISNVGPTGISFARYSIDYHILRNYLHVVDEWGEERATAALPKYAKDIVDHYRGSEPTFEKLRKQILSDE